jgi:hypothetical protein
LVDRRFSVFSQGHEKIVEQVFQVSETPQFFYEFGKSAHRIRCIPAIRVANQYGVRSTGQAGEEQIRLLGGQEWQNIAQDNFIIHTKKED